jgi:2-iminobutanoate/2-iminopropanoate deaminase
MMIMVFGKEHDMSTQGSPEPFYSMTRRAGDILFLSGFGPVKDMEVVGETIEEQTRYTMDQMTKALESEGATWADVVRVNVFLLDLADRDRFNQTYMEYFKGRMPTRRLIGAGDLFKGILVEIDAIAHVGTK